MKKGLCIILCTLCFVSLFGCSDTGKNDIYSETVYDAFDTVTTVTARDTDAESFKKHLGLFTDRLRHYDMLFSIYDEYDDAVNLYEINQKAGKAPVKADSDIIALLEFSKEFCKEKCPYVNICMGSVLSLWHEAREQASENPDSAKLPDAAALKKAAEHTDIDKLIIDSENETVFFEDSEMKLDVGATAKGFAAQLIADYLKEKGIWSDYAISIGGNVITSGFKDKNTGAKWNIQIENPDLKSSASGEVVSVSDMAVVTSGDYQRFFTVDGKRYCHIIDPQTLMPAGRFSGVSVITDKGAALADALSTALFILPYEEGKRLIDALDGTEAVWYDKEYNKTCSSGYESYVRK